jgi:hypothetical protein
MTISIKIDIAPVKVPAGDMWTPKVQNVDIGLIHCMVSIEDI